MRRFHDCLDTAIEKFRDISDDEEYTIALLEQLAAGRRVQGHHILYYFCEGVKTVWQTGFKP